MVAYHKCSRRLMIICFQNKRKNMAEIKTNIRMPVNKCIVSLLSLKLLSPNIFCRNYCRLSRQIIFLFLKYSNISYLANLKLKIFNMYGRKSDCLFVHNNFFISTRKRLPTVYNYRVTDFLYSLLWYSYAFS